VRRPTLPDPRIRTMAGYLETIQQQKR